MTTMTWEVWALLVLCLPLLLVVRYLDQQEKKQKEIYRQEALLQVAKESWVFDSDELCGDCGEDAFFGEVHSCAFLTTQDVSLIRKSSGRRKE
jgi:hypothetical protein